jgi:polar amino acid transport system permease protein
MNIAEQEFLKFGDPKAVGGAPSLDSVLGELRASAKRARRRQLAAWVATWLLLMGGFTVAVVRSSSFSIHFLATWTPYILRGVGDTLIITVASISAAMVIAVIGASARLARLAPIRAAASLYVSLVRGTPLIVQILFLYLALPQLVPATAKISVLTLGIMALSLNYGAYMTEILRAGIVAVPKGQREAAHSLGLSGAKTFQRIILPQAIKTVVPALGNDFIGMIKDSALVSVIGVQELLWRAEDVGEANFQSLETLLVAAGVYWVLTLVFSAVQVRVERRFARSGT